MKLTVASVLRAQIGLGAAVFLPAVAQADALQQQVLAAAKQVGPSDFAFTQTVVAEQTGKPARTFVSRYDPRRGANAWQLIKVDGRAPTPKEIADSAKMASRNRTPSYSRITEWFGAPATRVAATPSTVTYRFTTLPKGSIKGGGVDMSPYTQAEAVVNTSGKTPFVERARFFSTAPFRMMLVAKVERFVVLSLHRLLPDGRPVPEGVMSDFAGSLMGKAAAFKTRTTYSDVTPVR